MFSVTSLPTDGRVQSAERRVRERGEIDGDIFPLTQRGMIELAGLTSSFSFKEGL